MRYLMRGVDSGNSGGSGGSGCASGGRSSGVSSSSGGTGGSSGLGSYICTGSPSKAGSAKSSVAFLKSMIENQNLSKSSLMRVPRPMICLNSVMDWMRLSSTMSLQVWASTPVLMSCEVVAMTG